MPTNHVAASATLDAPPAAVYAVLADYRGAHADILPEPWFLGRLEVQEGGTGAGTVIRFRTRILGATRTIRAKVSEPEPGRVLAETDFETGAVTSFTVDPAEDGRSRVTIAMEWTRPGLQGWIERYLAPPVLRRIYVAEMINLERVAAGRR